MSNQLDVCKKYPIKDFPGLLLNKIVTERIKATFCGDTLENKEELSKQKARKQGRIQGGGGVMGVATPPNDFKKPRPSWSEV